MIKLYWMNKLRFFLETYNRELALKHFLEWGENEEKAITERWKNNE